MICFHFIGFLVIFIIIPQNGHSLFLQPVLEIINPTGSLSCILSPDETNYGDFDRCAIRVYTSNNTEGSQNTTVQNGMWFTNTFRDFIKTRNCNGFAATSDTGMGNCDLMPYETASSMILCICATSDCNTNLQVCQISLQSNPDVQSLPTIISSLSDTIQCADGSNSFSSFSPNQDNSLIIDTAELKDYFQTHSVLCTILVGTVSPTTQNALIVENYQSYLTNRLHALKLLRQQVTTDTPIQTDFNIYVTYNTGTETFQECACLQNSSCNNNINTCAPSVIQTETTASTVSASTVFTDLTSKSTTLSISITSESNMSVTMTANPTTFTSMMTDSITSTVITSSAVATSSMKTGPTDTTGIPSSSVATSSMKTGLTDTSGITSSSIATSAMMTGLTNTIVTTAQSPTTISTTNVITNSTVQGKI